MSFASIAMRNILCALALFFSYEVEASMRTYGDYLEDLGQRESGGDYSIANSFGYLGKYQFGEAALRNCRLYNDDLTKKNDWIGTWSAEANSHGVASKEAFLRTPNFQEFSIRRYNTLNWSEIVRLGLTQYIGQTIGGLQITPSSLLGGAHLMGPGNVRKFLESAGGIDPADGYGTRLSEYLAKFADYELPFK
ncbi:hypothetical protein [Microvirga sesbaniae]|uniref:hypothetical protein n=1 Tax=Microvirga sesbaniae TaxID=681392 RepID=UPI0021C755F1|nr:hypothetical protein [Microvirga sp. HBU67692]